MEESAPLRNGEHMGIAPAFTKSVRKIAPLTAAAGLAMATLVISGGPAGAVTADQAQCFLDQGINYNSALDAIGAIRERDCGNKSIELQATIEKQSGSGWVPLVTGVGTATYKCRGHALTTYRLAATTLTVRAACS